MCGRFTITTDPDKLAQRFGIDIGDTDWTPRYNVAPTQTLPVILNTEPHRFSMLRWGLVPFWADDIGIGNRLINARGETVATKPSFRTAFKKRRCLVPSDGFYEWRKEAGGKQPLRIVRRDGAPFAMAGLWEEWTDPGGQPLRTFTIITTEANDFMRGIHDRMPVILDRADEPEWLRTDATPTALGQLIAPCPDDELRAYPVSRRVNAPIHDDAGLIAPLTPDSD